MDLLGDRDRVALGLEVLAQDDEPIAPGPAQRAGVGVVLLEGQD